MGWAGSSKIQTPEVNRRMPTWLYKNKNFHFKKAPSKKQQQMTIFATCVIKEEWTAKKQWVKYQQSNREIGKNSNRQHKKNRWKEFLQQTYACRRGGGWGASENG